MTGETKRQLRAEAVERLKDADCDDCFSLVGWANAFESLGITIPEEFAIANRNYIDRIEKLAKGE